MLKEVQLLKLNERYIKRNLKMVRGAIENKRFQPWPDNKFGPTGFYLPPTFMIDKDDVEPSGETSRIHDPGYELWNCADYEEPTENGFFRVAVTDRSETTIYRGVATFHRQAVGAGTWESDLPIDLNDAIKSDEYSVYFLPFNEAGEDDDYDVEERR